MSEEQSQERIDDLILRIRNSAQRLADDHPARGDMKILSRTLRELRYAFKVFAPYRKHRKVTVFGSARTPAGEATIRLVLTLAVPWLNGIGWSSRGRHMESWRPDMSGLDARCRWASILCYRLNNRLMRLSMVTTSL